MTTITVALKKRAYRIIVGNGILRTIGPQLKRLALGSCAAIITTGAVKRLYGAEVERSLAGARIRVQWNVIADTEKSKSFAVAAKVLGKLSLCDAKQKVFIAALGGGVAGDLAGFVASIYRRGVPFVQVPTTLLAQVDSSIGGKTALDLPAGKNLVGTFYQPAFVLSDVRCLTTLDARQVRSGLAEVIKYALIGDKPLFGYVEKNMKKILRKDPACLALVVSRCAAIKARIVACDEKEEKGLRTILNFGHTIGHAIEAAGKFRRYTHGEAVALGMLVACAISRKMGLCPDKERERIERLIALSGLPVKIAGARTADIIRAHYHDKKFKGKVNRFVLLSQIGKVKVVNNIPLKFITEALQERV